MKSIIIMSDKVYEQMLDALNNQHFTDRSGEAVDMDFINNHKGLLETARNYPKRAPQLGFLTPHAAKDQGSSLNVPVNNTNVSLN